MSVKVRRHKRGWFQVHLRVRLPSGDFYEKKRKSPHPSRSASARWGEEWQTEVLSNWKEVLNKENGKVAPTFSEFVPRFIDEHARANKLKPSTIATYQDRLKKHVLPLIGEKRLTEIGPGEEQKMKARWTKLNAKTINSVLGVLAKLLNVAVEWGIIDAVPVKLRKLKVALLPYPFYDFAEYWNVVEAARHLGSRSVAIVLLGGDAGLRRGEIAGLEWSDIDFRQRTIVVQRTIWNGHITPPKGGRARTIPMTAALASALHEIRHLRGPRVFYTDDSETVAEGRINEWMAPVLRQAGIRGSRKVHILRHTFCSHLAMRGAPAKAIQELAGHTDLTTTMRYMHLAPGSLRSAVDLLTDRPRGEEIGNILETKPPITPNPT